MSMASKAPTKRFHLDSKQHGTRHYTFVVRGNDAYIAVWWDEGCGFRKVIGKREFSDVAAARAEAHRILREEPYLAWAA